MLSPLPRSCTAIKGGRGDSLSKGQTGYAGGPSCLNVLLCSPSYVPEYAAATQVRMVHKKRHTSAWTNVPAPHARTA